MSETALPKGYTQDWLARASLEERHTAWRNAREKGGPQGEAIAAFISQSGLAYTPRGYLALDDPRVVRLHDIINSPDGVRACEAAVAAGQPALAGVDGLIQKALGPDYCGENGTTQTAGDYVANMMRPRGWIDAGQKPMPEGSVAKSARFFKRKA